MSIDVLKSWLGKGKWLGSLDDDTNLYFCQAQIPLGPVSR